MLHQFTFTFAVLFLIATSAVSEELEAVRDSDKSDVIQKFIKYRYLVIGGGLRDGDLYRAQVRIFDEAGKLMIERTNGTSSETVELIRTKELEGPTTWNAKFPKLRIRNYSGP